MWRRCLLSGLAAWLATAAPASAFIAYVSNEKSNTVTVIDTNSWTVTKTIKVGQRPRGGAMVAMRVRAHDGGDRSPGDGVDQCAGSAPVACCQASTTPLLIPRRSRVPAWRTGRAQHGNQLSEVR